MLTLIPGEATLTQLETIWRDDGPVRLAESARSGIEASAGKIVPLQRLAIWASMA